MPHTKSAKKALLVSERKRSSNRRYLALTKESVKALEKTLSATPVVEADLIVALSAVYSRIDTLEKKNILKANTAARRKSSYAKMVKSVTAK
ncbi:30S ribosomal protein S20 [Candidatus Gracilibacteria bacterium]|nr:30S ribosomal protein S20 [Candidatus Gracilibacteria bacterium]